MTSPRKAVAARIVKRPAVPRARLTPSRPTGEVSGKADGLMRRESERRFRGLFENMTEGVAIHELIYNAANRAVDYRILDVNPAFARHTGILREKALGQRLRNYMAEALRPIWMFMHGFRKPASRPAFAYISGRLIGILKFRLFPWAQPDSRRFSKTLRESTK